MCFLWYHADNKIMKPSMKSIALIEKSNYFAARDLFNQQRHNLSARNQLLTGAALDNAFNRNNLSQEKQTVCW